MKGKINCYICKKCKYEHYTLNLCTGTTPFGIMCRNCKKEMAHSCFYQLPNPSPIVRFAWYRPIKSALIKLDQETQKHIIMGGLIMEELGNVNDYLDLDILPAISKEEWDKIVLNEYVA